MVSGCEIESILSFKFYVDFKVKQTPPLFKGGVVGEARRGGMFLFLLYPQLTKFFYFFALTLTLYINILLIGAKLTKLSLMLYCSRLLNFNSPTLIIILVEK